METAVARPDIVQDAHLRFLNELRESGACNMFGAGSYLKEVFPELSTKEARTVLLYWMETFED